MIAPNEKVMQSLRFLRTAAGPQYEDIAQWIRQSLHEEHLVIEQLSDANKLFNHQGRAACMRIILNTLESQSKT